MMTLDELIESQKAEILKTWADRVRARTTDAAGLPPSVLADNIPGVIAELIAGLKRHRAMTDDSPNAVEHGKQRLRIGFDLATVVDEYGILRDCVLDAVEASGTPITLRELRCLSESITVGIRDAVVEYTDARNRLSEMFVSVMAHDLRNPLHAISVGAALLLQQGGGSPELVNRVCGRIASSTERMTQMIEQLFDFAKSDVTGGLVRNREWTDAAELCKGLVGTLEATNPGLKIDVVADGPCTGRWDSVRLSQALATFATSMLGASEPQTVTITLDGGTDEVLIQIAHRGAVKSEDLAESFASFRAGSTVPTGAMRQHIARQIIAQHDGTVDVVSPDGGGTCFKIRLPRGAT